jgi:hypothetical protein
MAIAAVVCLGATAASAQPTFSEVQRAALGQQSAQVRVNIGINMFVPAAGGLTIATQEGIRRQIYDLASKECAVLRDTIADDCRMEGINVNVNRQHGQQPVEGFNVNANVNYRITLK